MYVIRAVNFSRGNIFVDPAFLRGKIFTEAIVTCTLLAAVNFWQGNIFVDQG